jgi:hypothetical protein
MCAKVWNCSENALEKINFFNDNKLENVSTVNCRACAEPGTKRYTASLKKQLLIFGNSWRGCLKKSIRIKFSKGLKNV